MIPNLCRLPVVLAITILLELLLIVHILSLSAVVEFDWTRFAQMSLYLLLVALSDMALLCQLRGVINRMSELAATVSVLVLLYGVVALVNLAWQQLLGFSASGVDWWWLLRDCMIATVLCMIALRYFYLQQRWSDEQKATENARYEALQSRIQPHFLFNTLNTIAALIAVAPQKAEAAIQDLSILLRKQIGSDRKQHNWSQERAICQAYLGIEALRYGDRLCVNWQVESVPDDLALPPLVLQPLLENAIRHGIAKMKEAGTINVLGQMEKSPDQLGARRVTVCVENSLDTNFLPYASTAKDQRHASTTLADEHGIALANVRARVAAFYRDEQTGIERASVKVEMLSGLCRITLQMPYICVSAINGDQRGE